MLRHFISSQLEYTSYFDPGTGIDQPTSQLGLPEVWVSFLSQDQTIGRMGAPCCLLFAPVAEAFQAILPNRFEHPTKGQRIPTKITLDAYPLRIARSLI